MDSNPENPTPQPDLKAESISPRKHHPRYWRRWWGRRLRSLVILLMVGLALLVVAVGAVFLFNIPVSVPTGWVVNPMNRVLARAGLWLDIGQLVVFPREFRAVGEGLSLSRVDRQTGNLELAGGARRLTVQMASLRSLAGGGQPLLKRVELMDVDLLTIEVSSQGRVRFAMPGRDWRTTESVGRLAKVRVDSKQQVQNPANLPGVGFQLHQLPAQAVVIRNASIAIRKPVTTGALEALPELVQLRDLEALRIAPGHVEYRASVLTARSNDRNTTGPIIRRAVEDLEHIQLSLTAQRTQPLRWQLIWPAVHRASLGEMGAVELESLRGEGMVLPLPGGFETRGRLNLEGLKYERAGMVWTDRDIGLSWNLTRTPDGLIVEDVLLDSAEVIAHGRGHLPKGDLPRGRLTVSRGGGPIPVALRQVLPPSVQLDWPANGVFIEVASDGTRSPFAALPQLEGRVSLTSITLALTGSVQDSVTLGAEARFNEHGLRVTELTVMTTDGLALSGQLSVPNPLLQSPNLMADLDMSFAGPTSSVLARVARHNTTVALQLERYSVRTPGGFRLKTQARVALLPVDPQMFSLRHYAELLPPPKLEAVLEVEPVEFTDPASGRMLRLAAMTSSTEKQAELVYLDVSSGTKSSRLQGQLSLGPEFLKPVNPKRMVGLGRLVAQGSLDDAFLREVLPANLVQLLDENGVGFRAGLTVTADNSSRVLSGQALPDVRVYLDNVQFSIPDGLVPQGRVPFRGVVLDATVQGASLKINRLYVPVGTGRTQVTARGSWTPGRLSLVAGFDGTLNDIQTISPRVFGPFDRFSGSISSPGIAFEMTGVGPGQAGNNLLDYWKRTASRIGPDFLGAWNGGRARITGIINVQNGVLRHKVFPPAKRLASGQSVFEAALFDMNGVIRVDKSGNGPVTLTAADGFRARPSGSPTGSLTGRVALRQGNLPEIDLNLRIPGKVDLDPWVFGWGTSPAARALPPPRVPNSGKVLNVRVALDALESRFQGQDSGPLQGVLNYLFTQSLTASRVLELKDLNVTDNRTRRGKRPGQALVNARFDFHPRNAPGWPRWEADVRLKPAFPVALLFGWTGSKVKISRSTLMEGEAKLSGQTFQPGAIEARGRMILSGLSSTELPILSALIQQTRLKGLNDTFSGDQPFQFKVRNGRAEFRELYLTQGYVRLNGQGEYTFAQPGGPLLQQGNLDALFRIEAVGTVLRQVPLVGRIPFVSRLISQGDQVISQLVLQFRVTGDPGNPTVEPQVGSGLLNPLGTVDQAVTGVTREIRRGGEQAPGFFARIIRWIIDRISPPIVHQWRREGLQVLPQPGTPGTVMIPGFVSPLRSPAVSAEPNRLR